MTSNSKEIRPWGRAAGLVTGCVVTLIGVGTGLSPHVITLRAVCSAVFIGILTAIAVRLMQKTGEGRH